MFVITIVSDDPWLAVKLIAEAALSLETKATCPPAILTSLASAASISTPPAVAVKAIAPSLSPLVLVITIVSVVPYFVGIILAPYYYPFWS